MPDHPQQHAVNLSLNIGGKFEFHVYVHFDHAGLAAKLGQATDKLKDAVAAASASPSESVQTVP